MKAKRDKWKIVINVAIQEKNEMWSEGNSRENI